MRRIDAAFKKFEGMARCEIIPNCCPCQIDPSLPDVDGNTYVTSDHEDRQGCRGITCEECWDAELE